MNRLCHRAFPFFLAGAVSACGGRNPPAPLSPAGTGSSGEAERTSSLPDRNFLDVSRFPLNHLISGNVAKDGIPALTDPDFVREGSVYAAYLKDEDLVLGLYLNGIAKAYPHNIGWHHEIINDVIGDRYMVITLCPLTGTGMVFNGQGEGDERLELGVSGLLFNNNLVMYDRRHDDTLYPQMTHIGIKGFGTERELALMPVIETTWGNWKRLYPGTLVVSSASRGMYRSERYAMYPYAGYRNPESAPLFPLFPEPDDNPIVSDYPPKEMVLGVRFGSVVKAYPYSQMGGDQAAINDRIADHNVLVLYDAAARMALPFSRDVGNRTLTFDRMPSTNRRFSFMLKDRETGTTWNQLGQALAGELEGNQLYQIPAHNAFWFAWATFWQDTGVYAP